MNPQFEEKREADNHDVESTSRENDFMEDNFSGPHSLATISI